MPDTTRGFGERGECRNERVLETKLHNIINIKVLILIMWPRTKKRLSELTSLIILRKSSDDKSINRYLNLLYQKQKALMQKKTKFDSAYSIIVETNSFYSQYLKKLKRISIEVGFFFKSLKNKNISTINVETFLKKKISECDKDDATINGYLKRINEIISK